MNNMFDDPIRREIKEHLSAVSESLLIVLETKEATYETASELAEAIFSLSFVLKDALIRLNSQEIMSGEEDNYESSLDDAITYCEEDIKGGVFQIIESLYERTGKSRSLENNG